MSLNNIFLFHCSCVCIWCFSENGKTEIKRLRFHLFYQSKKLFEQKLNISFLPSCVLFDASEIICKKDLIYFKKVMWCIAFVNLWPHLRGPRRVKIVTHVNGGNRWNNAIFLDFSLTKPYMQSKLMMFSRWWFVSKLTIDKFPSILWKTI